MPFDQQNFEMPPTDEILKRLLAGRAMLTGGWCRNVLRSGGSVCARGAITLATAVCWDHSDAVARAADDCLARFVPARRIDRRYPCPVVDFNNHPDTTHADVLALFDRAIAARKAELLTTNEIGAVGP